MTGIRVGTLDKAGIGVDRAGNASHEARSMDHIPGANTADIGYRPSNSTDKPAPINRERPKKATPRKQLLIKRSSSNYPPAPITFRRILLKKVTAETPSI